MPFDPHHPHCPKCKGKPTNGQRRLTETKRDKLTGDTWQAVNVRFASAYACNLCGAIYSYQDGFSTYIARQRGTPAA